VYQRERRAVAADVDMEAVCAGREDRPARRIRGTRRARHLAHLHRELGDRLRDDVRFAEAIVEDAEALISRADAMAAVGQAIERTARWLRPKRIGVGEVSVDPSYTSGQPAPADVMRMAFAELDSTLSHTDRPGAIVLYDEGHVLADHRAR
jgi:hypothetical protein